MRPDLTRAAALVAAGCFLLGVGLLLTINAPLSAVVACTVLLALALVLAVRP